MKILFWSIGKNHEAYISAGVEDFTKRIGNYFPVSWTIIAAPKYAGIRSEQELKKRKESLF